MSKQQVAIVTVPFGRGAGTTGAERGPEHIIQFAGLTDKLTDLNISYRLAGEVREPSKAKPLKTNNAKHLSEVYEMSNLLADQVSEIVAAGQFPLVLGGDHSIAIGTIAGLAEHYTNLGVIWFDAHSDLNTEDTSPSGNIHGMSLGISLGRGIPLLTGLRGIFPKIKPEHVAIVGARSLDAGEKESIRELGIACYTMHDIDRLGIARVMEKIIHQMKQMTDGVHISFDIDSIDPLEAPGTGTPVKGGLSYREAHLALEFLYQSALVTSAELVEVNPSLDHNDQTSKLAVELIASLLGDQIL
ncbi:arginase [Paenibacillus sp. FSL H8-0548]|uniref:arginase n=1 Tax=Paenibacillus sp. FSL H8-0548 TaxID=1920422 RepID=UPI00096FB006|nr:arginase [Paenibacillus sp. FSL H8-0548]OMF27585.1 arginase [Paenibacillus sp. FSL H8-0548]